MPKYVFDRHYRELFAAIGLPVREMLRASGLPEGLFEQREITITKEQYYAIMRNASFYAKDNDAAVVQLATWEGIETFSPPVYAAYCSSNATAFVQRLAKYKRLIGPMRFLTYDTDQAFVVEVSAIDQSDNLPPQWVETEVAFLLNLIRKATGTNVVPIRVEMTHRVTSQPLLDFIGCPVSVSTRNAMILSQHDAHLPFGTANDAMWEYVEPELRRRVVALDLSDATTMRVRNALMELIPAGRTTIDDMASKLCMSKRTLQRRLNEENILFKDILRQTRLELAKAYMARGSMSIEDIAFLLGYSDVKSFKRAFVSWTGKTVRQFMR